MAKKKKTAAPTIDPASLVLKDINVLGFSVNNDSHKTYYPEEADRYDFGIMTEVFSRKDYHLRVVVTIKCTVTFEDEGSIETSFMSECIFGVAPLPGVSKRKHFALDQLHKVTRLTAISLAYSTTRGLMYARAAGTLLEGAILPIVNPMDIDAGDLDEASTENPLTLAE